MNATDSPGWTKRRWAYWILSLFLLQVGLVLWGNRRGAPVPERPIFRTTVRLTLDDEQTRKISELVARDDPALLALPNFSGFSGSAWLNFAAPDYQPPEQVESPRWLTLREGSFGSNFASLLATSVIAPPLVADKPVPRLTWSDPKTAVAPITSRSRLRIDGDLAGRPMLMSVELPRWEASDVLSNTVVRAAVNADGTTVFAVILGQSGSRGADNYALELSNRLRFQPAPRPGIGSAPAAAVDDYTWGRLTFQWHTSPLSATNLPAILP